MLAVSNKNHIGLSSQIKAQKNTTFTSANIVPVYKKSWKNHTNGEFAKMIDHIVNKINKELTENPEHPLNKFLATIGEPNKLIKVVFKDDGMPSPDGYKPFYVAKARKLKGLFKSYQKVDAKPVAITRGTTEHFYKELNHLVTEDIIK